MRRLASIRILNGVKQKTLAEKVGISAQYLNNIEHGRVEPRRDLMKKIDIALNSTVQEIFFSNEE